MFYQLNINNAGGISDGNFTGIRFSQDSNAATELGNIKLHYYSTGATDLSFGTRYSPTALYIQSGGNVGIGTTSPTQKLHVVGNQYITGTITVGASGNNSNVNFVRGDGSAVGGIGWRSDGTFPTLLKGRGLPTAKSNARQLVRKRKKQG